MATTLPPGLQRLFKAERILGRGGYGVVWLAIQNGLDRAVALKVLHPGTSTEALTRFQSEARLAARLTHPNIVRVLDHGVEDGTPWIAYEFVDGRTCRDHLDEKPFSWSRAAQIVGQVALALEIAHEAGVLHRDVKPENVLLDRNGSAKLTDFGIAREMDGGSITKTGIVMGTPAYVAPEMIRHGIVAPSTDLYAAGVLLYELVAGVPPFGSLPIAKVLEAHVKGTPVPLRKRCPQVPPELDSLCSHLLEKDPAHRLAPARALRERLEGLMARHEAMSLSGVTRQVPRLPSGALPLHSTGDQPKQGGWRSALGVAGLLLCGVLIWWNQSHVRPVIPPPSTTQTEAHSRPAERGGQEGQVSLIDSALLLGRLGPTVAALDYVSGETAGALLAQPRFDLMGQARDQSRGTHSTQVVLDRLVARLDAGEGPQSLERDWVHQRAHLLSFHHWAAATRLRMFLGRVDQHESQFSKESSDGGSLDATVNNLLKLEYPPEFLGRVRDLLVHRAPTQGRLLEQRQVKLMVQLLEEDDQIVRQLGYFDLPLNQREQFVEAAARYLRVLTARHGHGEYATHVDSLVALWVFRWPTLDLSARVADLLGFKKSSVGLLRRHLGQCLTTQQGRFPSNRGALAALRQQLCGQ